MQTFLGIYDGHSGWDAAEFATEQLHKERAWAWGGFYHTHG